MGLRWCRICSGPYSLTFPRIPETETGTRPRFRVSHISRLGSNFRYGGLVLGAVSIETDQSMRTRGLGNGKLIGIQVAARWRSIFWCCCWQYTLSLVTYWIIHAQQMAEAAQVSSHIALLGTLSHVDCKASRTYSPMAWQMPLTWLEQLKKSSTTMIRQQRRLVDQAPRHSV